MEPTKQQIEMARRIAISTLPDASRDGLAHRVLSGGADQWHGVKSALAAIMETQRLDAELVERAVSPDWPYAVPALASRRDLASAIRTGEHYALAKQGGADAGL